MFIKKYGGHCGVKFQVTIHEYSISIHMDNTCIVCRHNILNSKRYLINHNMLGNLSIATKLCRNLPQRVSDLFRNRTDCNYICNNCFNLLKKRDALENNLKSCEDHITSFGNDEFSSDDTNTLRDKNPQSPGSDVPILHSTPIKRKIMDENELDNAFTKARTNYSIMLLMARLELRSSRYKFYMFY